MLLKRLVIGLGNPILGDDGVGWKIAQAILNQGGFPPDVEVDFLALGGISLMERIIGYDQVILIDAIVTHKHPIGTVLCFDLKDLPYRDIGHMGSPHDTSLPDAIQLGMKLGARLPDVIKVVAVESQNIFDFSEELTPPVESAIPKAVNYVNELIHNPSSPIRCQGITDQSKETIT
jgi:hydrogenase maturation protease